MMNAFLSWYLLCFIKFIINFKLIIICLIFLIDFIEIVKIIVIKAITVILFVIEEINNFKDLILKIIIKIIKNFIRKDYFVKRFN